MCVISTILYCYDDIKVTIHEHVLFKRNHTLHLYGKRYAKLAIKDARERFQFHRASLLLQYSIPPPSLS